MPLGSLYIISAPSGAGKTSLISQLIKQDPAIKVAISHTTRPMRDGEEDGKHYHFIKKDEFENKIEQKSFLEYAQVFGNYYGTSHQSIDQQLKSNHDIILEIDWQGAQQVRQLRPDAISIFILPPSVQALEQRLYGRGQDSQSVIENRLQQAHEDMSHYQEFDYILINDDFDTAVKDLASIFICQRMKLTKQQQRHQEFLISITNS